MLLDGELTRIEKLLSNEDPLSVVYGELLHKMFQIVDIKRCLGSGEYSDLGSTGATISAGQCPICEPEPSVAKEAKKLKEKKAKKEEPIELKQKESDSDSQDGSITKDMLKELLQNAADKGVRVQPLIAGFVSEGSSVKLSSVPESSYPALVKAVEKELEENGK